MLQPSLDHNHSSFFPESPFTRLVQAQRILSILHSATHAILAVLIRVEVLASQSFHLLLLVSGKWAYNWSRDAANSFFNRHGDGINNSANGTQKLPQAFSNGVENLSRGTCVL
jgi:hypothetical protein